MDRETKMRGLKADCWEEILPPSAMDQIQDLSVRVSLLLYHWAIPALTDSE